MNELSRLSDADLIQALKRWVADEKRSQARVIEHLAEFDSRELHAPGGYHSLFAYCTGELGYAEAAAYKRIQSARAARKFPDIIELLSAGRVSISAVAVLSPHLTSDNYKRLLAEAEGKSMRCLEQLVAALAPRPDKRDRVMRLLERGNPTSSAATLESSPLQAPSPPSAPDFALGAGPSPGPSIGPSQKIEALSPERVHFGFTGSSELRRKLDRAKELLWHKAPAGHLEDVIGAVLDFYLAHRDPDLRLAKQDAKPVPPSAPPAAAAGRRIPQAVKDAVWRRDGGRCAYVSPGGRRCDARAGLEYDHILPWAFGGESDSVKNIRLLCRTHNQRAARELGLFRPQSPQSEPAHRRPSA